MVDAGEVRYRCPVCGWDRLPRPAYVGDSPSHEICTCCGTQFGHQDWRPDPGGRASRQAELRARWIGEGMPWTGWRPAPDGWDPRAQLEALAAAGPDVLVHAVEVRVGPDDVELVSGLLWGIGVAAVAEEEQLDGTVVLRTDLPRRGWQRLTATLGDRWPWAIVAVDPGLDAWRAHARVVRAGRIVVRPPWVPLGEVGPGDVVVEIDPGASFGHGAHPTTRLCLEALDRLVGPGATVLDVGCGSGVLAIAAVRIGAARAVAVDIDPAAVEAARANAEANGVSGRVEVRIAAADGDHPHEPADVVVANIGAAALRRLAPGLVRAVAPGGALVLSGVLDPPPADLAAAFAPLAAVADERRDGWTALTLR